MLQPFDQPSPDTARTLRTKLTKASGWKCEKKNILCRQNMKSWKIYNFTTFEWNMGSWPLASMLMFDSACLGLVLILQIPALPIALATFAALALAHPFPVPTCITAIISPEKKRIRGCCCEWLRSVGGTVSLGHQSLVHLVCARSGWWLANLPKFRHSPHILHHTTIYCEL